MNRYIEASYELYVDKDGSEQLVESTKPEQPLKFFTGLGMVIDGFEKRITGFGDGEAYDITIPKNEAYGEYNDEMVFDIDKANFMSDGRFDSSIVHEDAVIPLQDGNGGRYLARVVSVGDDAVRVDLNHPLSGKELKFRGSIIVNREATDEEIEAFKASQHKHHCCGGCHGDGGGCNGGCHGDGGGCNGGCCHG